MTNCSSAVRNRIDVHVSRDYDEMSRAAAQIVCEAAAAKPDLLLCVATGSSPSGTYERMAAKARESSGLFKRLRILKLDEWLGLPMSDPAGCEAYLQERVVQPLGVTPDRFIGFESNPADPEAECQRISTWLKTNGPIDLCLLGLGANGHLGLNEPGPVVFPFAHRAVLSERTRAHPMLSQSAAKPEAGLTLGILDILRSRRILLLVNGGQKRKQLRRLLDGEISLDFPGSLLWLHSHVTLLCDRAAAGDEASTEPNPQKKKIL